MQFIATQAHIGNSTGRMPSPDIPSVPHWVNTLPMNQERVVSPAKVTGKETMIGSDAAPTPMAIPTRAATRSRGSNVVTFSLKRQATHANTGARPKAKVK